jgi:G3E family GTPase
MPMAAPELPVPLHLVTGFLGSGKTTLLQRLLRAPLLADTAVLVNEFGEIGLDHRLVRHVNERVAVIEGGCACCRMRDDLREALYRLFAAARSGEAPAFRRIILETSGLADPAPILFTLKSDYVLREYLRIGRVITTVDGVNGLAQAERQPEILKQIAVADTLVLTKSDIAEPARVAVLRERLRALNPIAAWHDAQAEGIDARLLGDESVGAPAREGQASALHGDAHDPRVRSFTLSHEAPLDWTAFSVWLTLLLARHGEDVLRVKGILNVLGSPTPLVIQGVQHIMHHPVHLAAWPDDDRRSHVVFIVRGIEPATIRDSLAVFQRLGDDLRARHDLA